MDDRIHIELTVSLPDAVRVMNLLQWATSYRVGRLIDSDPDDPVVQGKFEELVAAVRFRRQIEDIVYEIAKGE